MQDELTKFLKWLESEIKTSDILEDKKRKDELNNIFTIFNEYIKEQEELENKEIQYRMEDLITNL